MRHLKAGKRLGVTTAHRRAMMRNLVTSILEKGQVTCTLARAKEVRKPLEKMITLAKQGDLHSRRQALRFIKSKEAMAQLFGELGNRFSERQGGYSRIIKLGRTRLGDNADMAIVQLIGSENDQLSSLKKKSTKQKSSRKKDSKVLQKVSEEVRKAEENKQAADQQTPPPEKPSEKFQDENVSKEEKEAQATATEESFSDSIEVAEETVEDENLEVTPEEQMTDEVKETADSESLEAGQQNSSSEKGSEKPEESESQEASLAEDQDEKMKTSDAGEISAVDQKTDVPESSRKDDSAKKDSAKS